MQADPTSFYSWLAGNQHSIYWAAAGAGGIKGHFTTELVWAAVVELQLNALGAQLRSGSLGASDSVVTLSLVRQLKSINNKKQNF